MGSKRFSVLAVLLSVAGAILAFLLGEVILRVGSTWPSFAKVGAYFGIGAMLVSGMILISQKISPQLVGYRWKEAYFKNSLKLFVPTTLLMVGLAAGLLQFIYSLDIHTEKTIKNIVIAVDTSSSMEVTDPQNERFAAISSMIDNLKGDKQVALITFNDTPSLAIDFMPVKSDAEKEAFKSKLASLDIVETGQTAVRQAVDDAYNMLNGSGEKGSLILVSDGAPTDGSDSDIYGLVSCFIQEKMPVYTIGMMYSVPEVAQYLQQIAELTGGEFYNTSDVTMLKEAFGNISYNENKGTMVTPRTGAYITSKFYMALRLVFVVLVSFLMALALGIMFDNRYLVKGMTIGSLVGGLAGSVAMEVAMLKDTPALIARLEYWILFGIGLMAFTWCIQFKDSYHGTREA